jgi:periplasmic protein TonB
VADRSAHARELLSRFGVYKDVFEQSILLNHEANRPWNFVASLSAELLILSLALFISLASSDHLPAFHWQNVAVRPVTAPPPVQVAPVRASAAASTPLSLNVAPRPIFHLDPRASQPPQPASSVFVTDAPPSIGVSSVGESTNQVGKFLANMPAPVAGTPAVHPTAPSAPLRVGGTVQMAKLIRKVIPEYPSLARAARISGVVHLVGIIAKDGTIRNLQLIGGHPMLARAAMQAVEQWVYEPTLLNGEPVEVIAPIEVSFTLGR